jgi:hypothetical protein
LAEPRKALVETLFARRGALQVFFYRRLRTKSDAGELVQEVYLRLPISGLCDAYDADSFAAFLATLNGVVVRKTPPRIRCLRQSPAPREPLPAAR